MISSISFAFMINYTSSRQLSIDQFKTPFQTKLNKNNRWVILSCVVPWDDLANLYHKSLCKDNGAATVDTRIIIGAMIIKHKLNLDDREAIIQISENPYMQYFLGLSEFTNEPVFDPSLFVSIRKRMDTLNYDELIALILKEDKDVVSIKSDKEDKDDNDNAGNSVVPISTPATATVTHKGTLKVDGTVAPQQIAYPTDVDLLNEARENSERIIDLLWKENLMDKKPRTYRQKARKEYLLFIKNKKKSKAGIRAQVRKQLNYTSRNLSSIDKIVTAQPEGKLRGILSSRDIKLLQVMHTLRDQQKHMLDNHTNRCEDRIVSIYQPHVRPMVRGKKAAPVEFGSKIIVSECDGYFYISHFGWNNYNEAQYLKTAVEQYERNFGYYPSTVLVDGAYGTRENRKMLEDLGIEFGGKKLGRPDKVSRTARQKRAWRRKLGKRNHVEGKIGNAKVANGMDKIKARLHDTSSAWVKFITIVFCLEQLARAGYFLPIIFVLICICIEMSGKLNYGKLKFDRLQFLPNP